MRRIKLLLGLLLCMLIVLSLSGCDVLSSLIKQEGDKTPIAQLLENSTANPSNQAISAVKGEQTIKLFFPDKTGKTLITETRVIPKTLSLAKESVVQWLKGPDLSSNGSNAVNPVNPSTALRDIALKNGVAVVDLSKEFLQAYGQAEPRVVLYGLVNTLTQYSTVKSVSIRIEGQEIKTYRGQKTDNLIFNNDLLQESEQKVDDASGESLPSTINIFAN